MKIRFLLVPLTLAASPLPAQQTPQDLADAELQSLVTIYKDLHAHPELSTREQRSAGIVAKELKAAGCEVTEKVGKYPQTELKCYGVVGIMKNGSGPTVLVRADLDALPVKEETGVPYASTVVTKDASGRDVSVMHACGHDIHMATLIGAARSLNKLKDQWHGTIVFVGQPAEETGGGARALLSDGLYTRFGKPDFAIAFHDRAQLEIGKVGVTEGYSSANVDSVNITVRGVGGHGAYPHKTKDPIVISAEIVMALQTIASRENDPIDPIVVTIGSIHGGTKHNIIPDDVKMQMTVRTYKAGVRERTLAAIERITKGIAVAAGIQSDNMPIVEVLRDDFTPATYNNPELTKRLVAAWKKTLGAENVEATDPVMGGDDFSEYSLSDHSIPAVYVHVGAVDPTKMAESNKTGVPLPSLHSSKFAPIPEPTIRTGVIATTVAVLDLMKK